MKRVLSSVEGQVLQKEFLEGSNKVVSKDSRFQFERVFQLAGRGNEDSVPRTIRNLINHDKHPMQMITLATGGSIHDVEDIDAIGILPFLVGKIIGIEIQHEIKRCKEID